MKPAYDRAGAERLIPLLQAIHRETRERQEALRRAVVRVETLRRARQTRGLARRRARVHPLLAEIANHKLEIRRARAELARLGCRADAKHPERVLIPGEDGDLDSGYAWVVGDRRVSPLEPEGTKAEP